MALGRVSFGFVFGAGFQFGFRVTLRVWVKVWIDVMVRMRRAFVRLRTTGGCGYCPL